MNKPAAERIQAIEPAADSLLGASDGDPPATPAGGLSRLAALQRSTLLRFVPATSLPRLQALFEPQRYAFGEFIVREGEAADAWYILVSGRARIIRAQANGSELLLGRLLPGDEFGEAALQDGGLRSASVRASTTVELLQLRREALLALVEQAPELRAALALQARWRSLHAFLYQHSDFGRLPAATLQALMRALQPLQVAKGEQIVREGEAAGALFVVKSGRAQAWRETTEGRQHLAAYRAGDWFGERALLTGEPRAASVRAVEDCELLQLTLPAAQALRVQHPAFDQRLRERVAEYAYRKTARIPLDFVEELLPAAPGPTDGVETLAEAESVGSTSRPVRRSRLRPFPFTPQVDEMDCGAACLAMICAHFGRPQRLGRLRELCHTGVDGASLLGLCSAANELGLAARALKVSPRHLAELPLPAICHWQGHHWVVVYALDERHVWIADPARGRRKLKREQFLADWSGYSALFDYSADFARQPSERSAGAMAWVWPLLKPHRGSLLLAGGLAGLASLLSLLFPLVTQFVVDQVIVDQDLDLLTLVLGVMSAALLFLLSAQLIQQYLLAFLAVRVDSAALDLLSRRLLALPMSYFHSRRTGDLQRRLEGARQIRQFLVQQGIGGALALLQLLAAMLLMLLYSPLLAGVFAMLLPLYGVLMLYARRRLRPLYADIEQAQGRYASSQIDAIRGIEAVKTSAAELSFRDRMLEQFLRVARQQFRGSFLVMAYDSALQALGFATLLIFLWFGAREVIAGQMSIGALVAFNSLLAMAAAALLRSLGAWDELQYIGVLLNRLRDVFEHTPEQGAERAHLRPVRSLAGEIALEQVGLRYGGIQAPEILSAISLQFAPGRSYALVGRSGSGKTTLVKLLAGLIEPTAGTLRFDQIDSRLLNYRDLRRQIGFVLQENHLFDGSVLDNIAFGEPEPDLDLAMRAARLACAHEFISRLPLGYETRIGDSGMVLSGGQRQRIAIARALYRDPPILIFDEATSALDSESERAIQSSLAGLAQPGQGRTMIIIAHRLSTVREVDQIIVLEQGRVVEQGDHDSLLARQGLYFYLHSQQLGL